MPNSISFPTLLAALLANSLSFASSIPDYYSEPGFQPFRKYETQQVIEHIDPFNGALQLQYNDLVVPGNAGLDIVVKRIYRSPAGQPGILGHDYLGGRTVLGIGWDIHFGRIWHSGSFYGPGGCGTGHASSETNPVLELSDGTRKVLTDADGSNYGYITKDRWIGKCISGSTGGLEVVSPDGIKHTFDFYKSVGSKDAWNLTKIEDRFGNYLTIEYHPTSSTQHALIKAINASDGRNVSFHYINTNSYTVLLKEIRLNNSIRMEYNHKAVPGHADRFFLTDAEQKVTSSKENKWEYTYYESRPSNDLAGLYAIKNMESPFGTTTVYTYDAVQFTPSLGSPSSTVLKTKSISGGSVVSGTWSYSYNPGATDVTTIKSPNYCMVYKHKGSQSVAINNVWRIGTLLEKSSYDSSACTNLIQEETYAWTSIHVSSQNELHRRGSAVDSNTYQAVLGSKTVRRDGSSYTTTYSLYDGYGNAGKTVESGPGGTSRTTDYDYINLTDSNIWILGLIAKEDIGTVGSIDYDYYTTGARAGRLESISRFGVTTTYDYHTSGSSKGEISKITNPLNKSTTFTNYYRGVPHTENRPENINITRQVNYAGTIASETNGRSKTTSYDYDYLGRITSITTPKSNDSNITVDWSSGGRIKTVTRGTFSATYTSDGFGRLIKTESGSISKTLRYNAEGQLLFESYPSSTSQGITYQRDVLGRATRLTHADNNYVRYNYQSSNRVSIIDERGKTTTYTYQSYGDPDERYLTNIQAPETITTDIGRDKIGNILDVSQGGKTRNFNLDSRKFLDNAVHPETGTTDVGFDNAGNMTSRRVGSSPLTNFEYDDLNRLEKIDYPAGTDDVTFTYDGNNNLLTVTNATAKWTYTYDDNDNLETETLNVNAKNYTFRHQYNGRDNRTSLIYPNGLTINYSPDTFGRPTQISGFVSLIKYHDNSQIEEIRYVNGKTSTISLTNRLFPEDLATNGIINLTYGYDEAGNTTSITDNSGSTNNRSFTYDNVNRLKTASGPWGSGLINYSTTGDITGKNIGGITLTYSYANHKLDSISGSKNYDFSYDAYGNIIENGSNSFTYNDASQLTKVDNFIAYQYDGNNRRVTHAENNELKKITMYAKAGQLLFESDANNDFQSAYVYLNSHLIARQNSCENLDTDNDNLGSCIEIKLGLNPQNPDTDGDGINDGDEDSDGDTMTNRYEAENDLDPASNDADLDHDNDGLSNVEEFNLGTAANKQDTDNDSMPDGWEVGYGLNPLLNDASGDLDSDSLTNKQEYSVGTNPTLADSDGDGLPDANEDPDGDGLTNFREFQNGTLPLDADTDNDAMNDGFEVRYGLNPMLNDAALDPDNDGLTNLQEYQYNTNPVKADTDGDGVNDGDEIAAGTDPNFNLAALIPIIRLLLN